MKSIRGRSGITHSFTEVTANSSVEKVVEEHARQINELDVLRFYLKVFDVGARSAVISAPSCTNAARELASEYRIRLEIKRNARRL